MLWVFPTDEEIMTIKCFNVWTAIHAESGDMFLAINHNGEFWIANYHIQLFPFNFIKDEPQYLDWMLEGSMKKMLLTIGLEDVEESDD